MGSESTTISLFNSVPTWNLLSIYLSSAYFRLTVCAVVNICLYSIGCWLLSMVCSIMCSWNLLSICQVDSCGRQLPNPVCWLLSMVCSVIVLGICYLSNGYFRLCCGGHLPNAVCWLLSMVGSEMCTHLISQISGSHRKADVCIGCKSWSDEVKSVSEQWVLGEWPILENVFQLVLAWQDPIPCHISWSCMSRYDNMSCHKGYSTQFQMFQGLQSTNFISGKS